jgi:hypothetical protein
MKSDKIQSRHTYQIRCKAELCAKRNQFKTRDLIFVCAVERVSGFKHTKITYDAKQNKKELMGRKVDNCNTYSGHVWRCWFDNRDTKSPSDVLQKFRMQLLIPVPLNS